MAAIKVTITNSKGRETTVSNRTMEDTIKWYADFNTPHGTHYSYLTVSQTPEYAMLVRNIPNAVHTLEFELIGY